MDKYTISGLQVLDKNDDLLVDFSRLFNADGSIKFNPHHEEYEHLPQYKGVYEDFFKDGGKAVDGDMLRQLIEHYAFSPFSDIVRYYYAREGHYAGTYSVAIFWR